MPIQVWSSIATCHKGLLLASGCAPSVFIKAKIFLKSHRYFSVVYPTLLGYSLLSGHELAKIEQCTTIQDNHLPQILFSELCFSTNILEQQSCEWIEFVLLGWQAWGCTEQLSCQTSSAMGIAHLCLGSHRMPNILYCLAFYRPACNSSSALPILLAYLARGTFEQCNDSGPAWSRNTLRSTKQITRASRGKISDEDRTLSPSRIRQVLWICERNKELQRNQQDSLSHRWLRTNLERFRTILSIGWKGQGIFQSKGKSNAAEMMLHLTMKSMQ